MKAEPQEEHHWLQKLVGDWTYETEASMGPDKPAETFVGTESVRSLGGLWVMCEGKGDCGDGVIASTVMTLGFDPAKKRYVGSFIGSMMGMMWTYEGDRDAAGTTLTLDTVGPSFTDEGKMIRYQDIIEFISDDHRTLSSQTLGEDGTWTRFMTAHYRRVK